MAGIRYEHQEVMMNIFLNLFYFSIIIPLDIFQNAFNDAQAMSMQRISLNAGSALLPARGTPRDQSPGVYIVHNIKLPHREHPSPTA